MRSILACLSLAPALMITLQLSHDDAAFLADQLTNRSRHVEHELAHTDKRTLQTEIAHDLARLERLRDIVVHAIDKAVTDVAV